MVTYVENETEEIGKNHSINQILEMFVNSQIDLFNTYISGTVDNLEKNSIQLRKP